MRRVKFLIINADDFGYGDGVNRAAAALHDQGAVTSASLMVNTPGTAQAVDLAWAPRRVRRARPPPRSAA